MAQNEEQDARIALLGEFGNHLRNWYIILIGFAAVLLSIVQVRTELWERGLLVPSLIVVGWQSVYAIIRIVVHGNLAGLALKISRADIPAENETCLVRLYGKMLDVFKGEWCGLGGRFLSLGEFKYWFLVWTLPTLVVSIALVFLCGWAQLWHFQMCPKR